MTRSILLVLVGVAMFLVGAIVVVMTAGWLAEVLVVGVCLLIVGVAAKVGSKRRSAGIPSDADR